MSVFKFTLHCGLCEQQLDTNIDLPGGWASRYGGHDDETGGFCPKHSSVAGFCDSQCPGCVGGWGDCPLFDAFAYSSRRSLSDSDFLSIEKGTCPKRVNGTMRFDSRTGVMERLDLRSEPDSIGGKTLAQAIRDYIAKYP